MATLQSDERFWRSSRGQIVALLRRAPRTVAELAQALGLTDNAVRATLATLERDGLVRPGVRRPGPRKPNQEYDLTPAGEALYPKPYALLVRELLSAMAERLDETEREKVVQAVAARLAELHRGEVTADGLRERVEQAVAVLSRMGGLAEVRQLEGALGIQSYACPVALAVTGDRTICRVVEDMLGTLLGCRVRQDCQIDPSPRCYFAVEAAGA